MKEQKSPLLRGVERAELRTSAILSGITFMATVGFFVAAPFVGAAALGYLGYTQALGLGAIAKAAVTLTAAAGGLALGVAPLYALRSKKETPSGTLELMTIPAAAVDKGVSKMFAPLKRLCLSAMFNKPSDRQSVSPKLTKETKSSPGLKTNSPDQR